MTLSGCKGSQAITNKRRAPLPELDVKDPWQTGDVIPLQYFFNDQVQHFNEDQDDHDPFKYIAVAVLHQCLE